jgi:hypothetical protein
LTIHALHVASHADGKKHTVRHQTQRGGTIDDFWKLSTSSAATSAASTVHVSVCASPANVTISTPAISSVSSCAPMLLTPSSNFTDAVTSAETLWVLKLATSHLSYRTVSRLF